ncbi:MAG: nucleotidyl transferase AbiEii/AbiGii toxin family protein [Caldilineales bacterium]|nr:nucleotidyl transferase AbiEii/AbiGii toxin family protein [Caldilineales bacterium]MCW5859281.1 nucleotidyl transferase AbiEii/AbiGii toxin family protein [Caldilineales bacterium]
MDSSYYFEQLYPLQDRALEVMAQLDNGLYLTGGTATSRGYLHHRFSDDLDFFANDDSRFVLWTERTIDAFASVPRWQISVSQTEARFARFFIEEAGVQLKIEMVNDVPARVGEISRHPVLGRLDSPENILANKVTAALDRAAAKDLADIWGFCTRMGLSLEEAIMNAHSKAAGIFPPDLARVLLSATETDWRQVRWWQGPEVGQFLDDLRMLGEQLIYAE